MLRSSDENPKNQRPDRLDWTGKKSPMGSVGDLTPIPTSRRSGHDPACHPKMGWFKRVIAGLPDVRLKKIHAFKQSVESGNYRVESKILARAVVDEAAQDAVHRGKKGLERWPQS